MINIAICDDQEVVCQGLGAILSTAKDLRVIGISNNGQELLEFLEHKPVDVILMDLKMPILNGIQATKLIKENFPTIKILVLTTYDADVWLFDAIRNGADGYLLKDTSRENLILAKSPNPASTSLGKDLSEREMQILHCLSHGLSNAEIAQKLFLSEGTVRNYVSGILEKLEVEDRTQAAVLALRYGLVD
jgi:DNA-binding NarL/FixJ family response regulator